MCCQQNFLLEQWKTISILSSIPFSHNTKLFEQLKPRSWSLTLVGKQLRQILHSRFFNFSRAWSFRIKSPITFSLQKNKKFPITFDSVTIGIQKLLQADMITTPNRVYSIGFKIPNLFVIVNSLKDRILKDTLQIIITFLNKSYISHPQFGYPNVCNCDTSQLISAGNSVGQLRYHHLANSDPKTEYYDCISRTPIYYAKLGGLHFCKIFGFKESSDYVVWISHELPSLLA